LKPQLATDGPGEIVNQDIEHRGDDNQYHGAVKPDIGKGGIDVEIQRMNTQNTEDCCLAHDDFPAINQESQYLGIDARQHFICIEIDAVGPSRSGGGSRSVYRSMRWPMITPLCSDRATMVGSMDVKRHC